MADLSVVMEMWTIYEHPLDYPDYFVARRWLIVRDNKEPVSTPDILMSRDLQRLREFLPRGLTRMPRQELDDEKIIETWF